MKISLQLFFTLFLISGLSAQSEIKGKLVDLTTGESIPFGHIVIVDKKTGVLSDESGAFTLMGVDASDTISFTSVGYIEKRIVAANINAETIGLERKNNLLEEVLIVSSNTKKNLGDAQKKADSFINNSQKQGGFQILRLIRTDCDGCRISKVSFFIHDFSKVNNTIRLRLYTFDEQNQVPQNEILNRSILFHPLKKQSWIELSHFDDTLISSGKYLLVGVELLSNDDTLSLGLTNHINDSYTFIKSIGGFWYKSTFMKDRKNNFLNLMVKLELN